MYRDVGGYDMSYDDYKHLCKKAWEEECNYLYKDISKKRDRGRYCVFTESKNTYTECIPESKPS